MTPARISPEPDPESVGDYKIDRDIGRTRRPAIDHILALANALLLLIITAVSFALFWIVATLLGII